MIWAIGVAALAAGAFVLRFFRWRGRRIETLGEPTPEHRRVVIKGAEKEAQDQTDNAVQEVKDASLEDLIARGKRFRARGKLPPAN